MAKITSITNARKDIYKIVEDVCETHEEVIIYNASTGSNAVLLSEEDWKAIQETLLLSGIPGMTESLKAAAEEDLSLGSVYNPAEEW